MHSHLFIKLAIDTHTHTKPAQVNQLFVEDYACDSREKQRDIIIIIIDELKRCKEAVTASRSLAELPIVDQNA